MSLSPIEQLVLQMLQANEVGSTDPNVITAPNP